MKTNVHRGMHALARPIACLASCAMTLLLVVGLYGCGGSKEPLEDVAVVKVSAQQPFEGRKARDVSELEEKVESAIELARMRESSVDGTTEEAELTEKTNKDFTSANEAYKEGDYAQAQQLYEGILDVYALHYGANVNITLAFMQQQDNEAALVQALACCYLFPTQSMMLLNVQAAGVACGFSTEDLEAAMREMVELGGSDFDHLKDELGGEYTGLYAYNRTWDRIDTLLYAEAQRQAAQGEAEGEQAVPEEQSDGAGVSEETLGDVVAAGNSYEDLDEELNILGEEMPSDSDVPALHAYLYAIGLQLGLTADASLMEPVHTMPFVAVDDELCRIEARELANQDGYWSLMFTLANKTAGADLMVRELSPWTVDGKETAVELEAKDAEDGQDQGFRVIFMNAAANADDGEDGQEAPSEVLGVLQLKDGEGHLLRAYPISWHAGQA